MLGGGSSPFLDSAILEVTGPNGEVIVDRNSGGGNSSGAPVKSATGAHKSVLEWFTSGADKEDHDDDDSDDKEHDESDDDDDNDDDKDDGEESSGSSASSRSAAPARRLPPRREKRVESYYAAAADDDGDDSDGSGYGSDSSQSSRGSRLAARPAATRRSAREKKSTLVYVDGFPVLSANNYVVKGHEYVYQPGGESPGNKSPRRRWGAGGTKYAADRPPPAKKARRGGGPSRAERDRTAHNGRVTRRRAGKDELRRRFLRRHSGAIAPFAAPGMLRRLSRSLAKGPPRAAKKRSAYSSSSSSSASSYSSASSSSASSDEDEPASDRDREPEDEIQEEQPVEQPLGIEGGSMRDFQLAGLNFLVKMHRQNLGMILADEMGLVRSPLAAVGDDKVRVCPSSTRQSFSNRFSSVTRAC
jgi:hypothetical protein